MHSRLTLGVLVRAALAGGFLLLLGACTTGIRQSEYDALKQRLTTEEKKVAALQQQLSAQAQKPTQAPGVGAPEGVTVLLGAVILTPAPPRPTPTPLPADAPKPTAAPSPVLPASYGERVPIFIYADTVIGTGSKYNVGPTSMGAKSACAISGVFKRGMRIVWRFEAVDTGTGKRLTDADVESAIVRLPHGEELAARFSRHGATDDAPWFWATAWDIPLDYPLGSLDWRIEIKTKDGKVGTFRQLQVFSNTSDSRTQIVE